MSERFEKAHVIPRYRGGTNDSSNVFAIPLALHSFLHELIARDSGSPRDKFINHRASRVVRGRGDDEDKSWVDKLCGLLDNDIQVR